MQDRKTVALLAALRMEVNDVGRELALRESGVQRGCRLLRGTCGDQEVLLVQTGTGRERAEAAAMLVLESYPVACIVSFGFAGALDPDLKAGSVVICESVHCGSDAHPNHEIRSTDWLAALAARELEGKPFGCRLGADVTVDRLIVEPREKRELRSAFGALAVDMESYWVGRAAAACDIPFLAIRAISDGADQQLPPLEALLDHRGELLWRESVTYLMSHPAELAKLRCIHANTRLAARSLALSLRGLLPRLQTALVLRTSGERRKTDRG